MKDYLDGLNHAQKDAVINYQGPSLVIAGAGSGKTRVLTFRIAHLLKNGVKPYEILSLTFTNKAAKEMRERISLIVGSQTTKYLWMGTFHSIFARILRKEAEHIGFVSNFTIYDTADSKNLLKSVIKEMALDPNVYKISGVLSRISSAKNDLITAEMYQSNNQLIAHDRQSKMPELSRIYKLYVTRCRNNNAMDFDDLLLNTNVLFRNKPEVLEKYQEQFKYILVDEYQDTNFSQFLIIKKLSAKHRNICVVGDDAQSIYSFRGAKIENILNFRNDYPEYQLFKLEQNYRSTQNIVNAANSVISKNRKQIKKDVFSENDEGELIRVFELYTDAEEGYLVANKINDLRMSEHYHFRDFAILYRTNAQSRIFEESLRKKNIPYRIYGGLSFYQRKEIKDILAYCRLVVNKNDNEAIKRIINYPKRGIGDASVDKIEEISLQAGVSMWHFISNIDKNPELATSGRLMKPLLVFREMISSLTLRQDEYNAADMLIQIARESGMLKEMHSDQTPEGISRYENIQELMNAVQEFVSTFESTEEVPTLANYLQNVALLTDQDTEKGENDVVTLMTIHASKGLEFKNVFLVGMEEDLFPGELSTHSASDLEEERRLFYVAVTRAEKNLVLSYAKSRYKWGTLSARKPSRFIQEIDAKYLDWQAGESQNNRTFNQSFKGRTTIGDEKFAEQQNVTKQMNQTGDLQIPESQNSSFKTSAKLNLKAGDIVEHQKFGIGQVLQINESGSNSVAIVNFQNGGSKQLLLKFANLRVIKK